MMSVTIHTNASAAERAIGKLKAYADSGGREKVRALVESLGGYEPLLALSSKVEDGEVYVTITPSEKLTEFLAGAEG